MKINENQQILFGLLILSLCAALARLFFTEKLDFKSAFRIMLGGFFFGSLIAYIIHDIELANNWKRGIVIFTSTFAQQIYNIIKDRIGSWLDKIILIKIGWRDKENNNENQL